MRVFVTGMGGELGTRVAVLLEADPSIEAVAGVGITPPRRRLHRTDFHRVDPRNRARMLDLVRDFAPQVVVHLGVYEPDAQSTPPAALERTAAGTIVALGAAVEAGSLERIVMRSGIEIYGRRRGSPIRPDEDAPTEPSSPFGWSLHHAERIARAAAAEAEVPLTALRFAPLVGPHVPSPLGRLLRLPAAPYSPLSDLPFSLLHQEDAARAVVAAATNQKAPHDGPVNVVGAGAVTPFQALRLGGRIPLPIVGPGWRFARVAAELAGAPVPDHVAELLTRGRTADGSACASLIGTAPEVSTPETVKHLFEWASVAYLSVIDGEAA